MWVFSLQLTTLFLGVCIGFLFVFDYDGDVSEVFTAIGVIGILFCTTGVALGFYMWVVVKSAYQDIKESRNEEMEALTAESTALS